MCEALGSMSNTHLYTHTRSLTHSYTVILNTHTHMYTHKHSGKWKTLLNKSVHHGQSSASFHSPLSILFIKLEFQISTLSLRIKSTFLSTSESFKQNIRDWASSSAVEHLPEHAGGFGFNLQHRVKEILTFFSQQVMKKNFQQLGTRHLCFSKALR